MRVRVTGYIAAVVAVVFMTACAQTDAGITTAVKGKFAADDQVKAYQIDVDTRNKVVTLSGRVDSAPAKTRAVEIARATDGVANVVDNIQVTDATAARPDDAPLAERAMFSDAALTTSVKAKLAADPTVSALRIDVDTENQVVTLSGEVRSQTEKDLALKLAREVEGVKSVTDKLTVR